MDAAERFFKKVKDGPSFCWLWVGATTSAGYGLFWDGRRYRGAHVWAYESVYGPVPQAQVLDHLCRVRHCVNPLHLEAVSVGENIRRGETGIRQRQKKRCPYGHAYTEHNTYHGPTGRECRTCRAERERKRAA